MDWSAIQTQTLSRGEGTNFNPLSQNLAARRRFALALSRSGRPGGLAEIARL
jgi:hypothetical protein